MIIDDSAATARLNSPLNLINRLKNVSRAKDSAMQLFTGPGKLFNPFAARELSESQPAELPEKESTTLDTILADNESQIKLGLAHDKALSLLVNSVGVLESKLSEVSVSKLPQAILAASKVVESIRRERTEASKNNKDREVHYHFYTPDQKKMESYEVIDVT